MHSPTYLSVPRTFFLGNQAQLIVSTYTTMGRGYKKRVHYLVIRQVVNEILVELLDQIRKFSASRAMHVLVVTVV